ncbi:MAG: endonuclease III [Gemmatimonadaceae bacterium]
MPTPAKKTAAKAATKKTAKPMKAAPNAAAMSPAKRKKKRGAELKAHAYELLRRLKAEYPDAHCELDFETPLQLLIATILSAQCTDKRVNMVTPELFRTYPDAERMSAAKTEDLEELIKSTGFFRNKTKSLLGMSAAVSERHDGSVPSTMQELVNLPGVGRKTANVVLGNAFGMNEGVVVDTHVGRLAVRLGLTDETDPVKVERALMPLFPRDDWALLSHLLIFHGRRVCFARAPNCPGCMLTDICPSARV